MHKTSGRGRRVIDSKPRLVEPGFYTFAAVPAIRPVNARRSRAVTARHCQNASFRGLAEFILGHGPRTGPGPRPDPCTQVTMACRKTVIPKEPLKAEPFRRARVHPLRPRARNDNNPTSRLERRPKFLYCSRMKNPRGGFANSPSSLMLPANSLLGTQKFPAGNAKIPCWERRKLFAFQRLARRIGKKFPASREIGRAEAAAAIRRPDCAARSRRARAGRDCRAGSR